MLESKRSAARNPEGVGPELPWVQPTDRIHHSSVPALTAKYDMNLTDASLSKVGRTGLVLTTDLDTQAGTYFMRVIVRDSESGLMSMTNETVEIPY